MGVWLYGAKCGLWHVLVSTKCPVAVPAQHTRSKSLEAAPTWRVPWQSRPAASKHAKHAHAPRKHPHHERRPSWPTNRTRQVYNRGSFGEPIKLACSFILEHTARLHAYAYLLTFSVLRPRWRAVWLESFSAVWRRMELRPQVAWICRL